MPFISFERKIPASGLIYSMKSIMMQAGWYEVDEFCKYVIVNDCREGGFCYVLARHVIMRNSKGDYYGIATVRRGAVNRNVYIPSEQRLLNDDMDAVNILDDLRNEKEDNYRVYLYQLDRYWKQLGLKNKVHVFGYKKTVEKDEEEDENYGCGKEMTINGGIGVDVSSYYMGSAKKRVFINYNMHSVPDRIDVFYNGQLVASTKDKDGSNNYPGYGFVQQYVDYNDVTTDPYIDIDAKIKEGEGFVSYEGTLEFEYDPVEGDEEIVVMAIGGTLNTGWTYNIDCEIIDDDSGEGGDSPKEEGLELTCKDTEKMLLLSLDVEHTFVDDKAIESYEEGDKYEILSSAAFHGDFFQSPIVVVDTVDREYVDNRERFPEELNLWEDSLYRFDGCVDSVTAVFTLEVDTASMWESNVAPRIPIYMGGAEIVGEGARYTDACLFAGTAFQGSLQDSRFYGFTDTNLDTKYLIPIAKEQVYVNSPSNGITTVMFKRTKLGAWYQQHFISSFTPANEFPIPKEGEDREQYARSFQHYWTDSYKYQFNPSRYTEKVHVSRPKIIHPELGVTAMLRNILLIQDLSIIDRDELVYLDSKYCPESTRNINVYTYFKISSVSPLTKKSAVVFIPNAIGVRKQ